MGVDANLGFQNGGSHVADLQESLGASAQGRLIRPGGYDSVDDMVNHLVPAMMGLAEKSALRLVKKEEPQ